MSGFGGLPGSKCVMCLSGGVCFVKDSAHDETYFLGGRGDTACGTYIV